MDLISQAAQWLGEKLEECFSVPVAYISKDGKSFDVTATIGKTLFRAENEYGLITRIESRDFLIPKYKLPIIPQRGDKIIYDGTRYEVLAPNGEAVWRWSGENNILRRIHTKEIGGV